MSAYSLVFLENIDKFPPERRNSKSRQAAAKNAAGFLGRAVLAGMPDPIKAIQINGGSEFMAVFETACAAKKIPLYVLPPRSPSSMGRRTLQRGVAI